MMSQIQRALTVKSTDLEELNLIKYLRNESYMNLEQFGAIFSI